MLELDLVLLDFLEHRYPQLDPEGQEAFAGLLDEEDDDLMDYLYGRRLPKQTARRRVIRLMCDMKKETP
jgi:antitoxin CptB